MLHAREQYQDEMIELEEKEEGEDAENKLSVERKAKEELMDAANMLGVEGLFENMVRSVRK